jgi:hypothetical protein
MSNELDEVPDSEVGHVKVYVTSKEVHRAVQNILKNEMKLDPEQVKRDVQTKAEELIHKEVLGYLTNSGYGHADLTNRVKSQMEYEIRSKLTPIVREIVTQLVHKEIRDEVQYVIGVIIKDGIEIRLGWSDKRRVKVTTERKPE